MDTQKAVWALVAVVVLGGAWYFLSGPSSETPGSETVATTSTQATQTPSKQTPTKPPATKPSGGTTTTTAPKPVSNVKVAGINTLSYLYELKQPLVCTVTVGTTLKRSGTMYIADAKMRANFTASSMIDDGSYLYVWLKGASKGISFPTTSSVGGSVIATNGGFDPGNPFSFSCNAWTKDASLFTPPASITFGTSL